MAGADPGWSVRGGGEDEIGSKWADFTRFWPILEGAAPPRPLLDPPLVIIMSEPVQQKSAMKPQIDRPNTKDVNQA